MEELRKCELTTTTEIILNCLKKKEFNCVHKCVIGIQFESSKKKIIRTNKSLTENEKKNEKKEGGMGLVLTTK